MTATTNPSSTRTPSGVRWSTVWRTDAGDLTEGEQPVPVDEQWRIAGHLWLCPTAGCDTAQWLFGAPVEVPCCPRHPTELVNMKADPTQARPVSGARARLRDRVQKAWERKQQRAVDAAKAKMQAAQDEMIATGRRTADDLRGHVPSLAATGVVGVAGGVVATVNPALAIMCGAAAATVGVAAAYLAVCVVERVRARRSSGDMVGKAGRRARRRARQAAYAVLAAGAWVIIAGLLGVNPATIGGDAALLSGCVLAWAAWRRHWEQLWDTRVRLRELARRKAEAAQQRAEAELKQAEEAEKPAPAVVADSPIEMGRMMQQQWRQIAESDTVPVGFMMRRTWIVPEETRELTIPDGKSTRRIGWEYRIECQPGVLVARAGGTPPLVAAREWLASMLGIEPGMLSIVDRPDNQPNRGLMTITEGVALADSVAWKGRAGIRIEGDIISGHIGDDLRGNPVYTPIHIPGQLTGGLTVGTPGGGKSVGARISVLNDLCAGVFPILFDPVKSLGDFNEFVGIFPMGCTAEHRDVIIRSLHAEQRRRSKAINGRVKTDRHGRRKPEPAEFKVGRDGPKICSYWDEFHRNASDKAFLASFVDLMRVQRSVAMDSKAYTQGGGLDDMGNSVLRGILNQTTLTLYRLPDQQARLAGYIGNFMPSQLPRIPGACLVVAEGVEPIPLRGAWVTREDEDGSVYDHLYAPDGTLILPAPALPKGTIEVFEREGLMDLWRLGQEPDGLVKLIDDSSDRLPPPGGQPGAAAPGLLVSTGSKMSAADVVLAIVAANPGCPREKLGDDPVWTTAPGWGSAPVPSTVSRAAKNLVESKLLVRKNNQYQVTANAEQRAQAVRAALLGGPIPTGAPSPSEPSIEEMDEESELDE